MPDNAEVKTWLEEISTARRREKTWRKDGQEIRDIYDGKMKDEIPFNILFSNTETLIPALYNSTPRPVVQRRFKDEDPLGKMAATAGQRMLEFTIDTNSENYQTYDDAMTEAVIDALLPGRGATRCRYDYTSDSSPEAGEVVKTELVCYESVKWNKIIIALAKKWKDVPWIAYDYSVTRKEATELFGAEKAAKLKYVEAEQKEGENDEDDKHDDSGTEKDEQKVAQIYEIWDKDGERKVRFVADSWKDDYLKVDDDPLGVTGFFPMPEPIRFHRKSNNLTPTALYKLYENQATELNNITIRINRLIDAMKVRGAYDQNISELEQIMKLDDNELIGASNVAALQDKGLEKAIWLVPIERLITVIQQLYLAREAIKKVIYEISGIADIIRGSSQASETLGAQEIKEKWVTLRLKRMQKDVQRYAREVLRISLEIAANKFSTETWGKMTGLPYPSQQMKMAAQMTMQQAQMMQQPPPPQAAQIAQQPAWEEVLSVLRDDTMRQYRIDIETNSTIDLEATEDQKNIGEVMNAMAQFLNGVAPLVENGTLPFQAAQAMLLSIVRRYRFGTDVEDSIKQMTAPKPPDDGKAAAAQMDMQIKQVELQGKQQESATKQQQMMLEAEMQKQEMALRQQEMAMEMEFKKQEHAMKMAELQANAQFQQQSALTKGVELQHKHAMAVEMGAAKMAQAREMGAMKMEQAKKAAAAKPKANG